MGRPKKEKQEVEINNLSYRDKLEKEIRNEFGEYCFDDVSSIIDTERQIISLSPALDVGISGGMPEACIATLSGAAKCGKSTLALTIAKNAQKLDKTCYYLDIESRLQKKNLTGIKGLDLSPEKFVHIKSTKDKLLTGEEWLTIAEKIIKSHPSCILILDSSSALCSEAESVTEIKAAQRNSIPKLMANFLRKVSSAIQVNGTMLIIIQHLIFNTSGSMHGPTMLEDGGVKIMYQADLRLRNKYTERWKVGTGENEKIIGQICHWEVVTSALGAPGSKVKSYLRYGIGLDDIYENLELAISFGLIDKAASWFTYNEQKYHGMENLYDAVSNNHEMYEKIQKEIKDLYK